MNTEEMRTALHRWGLYGWTFLKWTAAAAVIGAACGLVLMQGGDPDALARTIRNMASSITGMICDGGNQGCVMKGVTAVDAAFRAATFARSGVAIDPVHGINAPDPETTMRYMGRIASPGMVAPKRPLWTFSETKRWSKEKKPYG